MNWFRLLILLPIVLGCSKKNDAAVRQQKLENKVVTRTVTLYFESPEMTLAPELRTLAVPEREAAAVPLVIQEVLKGSANAAVPRLFPPDVALRGAYLLPDGTAIVDLGGPSLASGWTTGSHAELAGLYAIVQSLSANFQTVKGVRFLVNGQTAETFAGHVRIDRSLRPNAALVSAAPAVLPAAVDVPSAKSPSTATSTAATR